MAKAKDDGKLAQTMIEGTGKKPTPRVIKCAEELERVRYEWKRLVAEDPLLETALLGVMEKDGVESFTLEDGTTVNTKITEAKKKIVMKRAPAED